MDIYEKNLSAIKEKDSDLYDAICKKESEEFNNEFYITQAKNGQNIICYQEGGREQYMSSRYNPDREAEGFVKQYDNMLDYSNFIFWGLGTGLVAEKLVEKLGEHVTYLFIEPSYNIFLLVLHNFDLTKLFNNERTRFVIYELNDDRIDYKIGASIRDDNYKISFFESLPVYGKLFSEERDEAEKKYIYSIENTIAEIKSYRNVEKNLVYNDIFNMRTLFNCNCEEEFRGVFPIDRPAIIVAAGPSLEKNAYLLKEAKGKFLIIAVDSAVSYLYSRGIYPDITLVVDSEKPEKLFENIDWNKSILAIASDVNYKILEGMTEKIVVIMSLSACYNKLFRLSNHQVYTMPNGGSVATVALSLAVGWGYRSIVLVGQDLAYTSEKMHAGNTDEILLTDDRKEELANSISNNIEIEGYYGDKVYTSWDFDHYRRWYEVSIRGNKDLEIINATEGGAKIQGAKQMSLQEVIDEYKVEPFDFEKTIREMPPTFSEEQRIDIVEEWRKSLSNLDILKEKLHEGIEKSEKAIGLLKENKDSSIEITKIQSELNEISSECDEYEEIFFLHEMAAKEEADVLTDIYAEKEDAREEVLRVFQKILKYMKALYEPVEEVKEMYNKIISETIEKYKLDC
ncbi:MAG: motility associated factor glycosyltransferase family protein [Lachnospiraceae bacterium]|nr:motility associated factor glycosyltransferase family protein [Lachnospiraceae bacterium]